MDSNSISAALAITEADLWKECATKTGILLTEDYFNITTEDYKKADEIFNEIRKLAIDENLSIFTATQINKFIDTRLTTYLGTRKQIGDRQLYATIMQRIKEDDGTIATVVRLEVFVERELPLVREKFTIRFRDDSNIPMLFDKSQEI